MDSGELAAWAAVVIGAVGIVGAWRAFVVSRATRNDEIERIDAGRHQRSAGGWGISSSPLGSRPPAATRS